MSEWKVMVKIYIHVKGERMLKMKEDKKTARNNKIKTP